MAQVTEEEQDPGPAMDTQPEAADLEQQTPNTTGKKIKLTELKDQESEKIRRMLARVKSVLEKSAAKRRRGKKPQILIFYYRRDKKNAKKPEDEENPEDSPGTSNSPGLPRAEDTAVSTASPEKELEK
ncbi:hypothetical protein mRhiFer1_007828 [Rhinolophus ferrumequinum]|uniref:Uncharacterized protein n=1 Tax=Rhinolophus ferrumequinum TaxID=59479 RepID=A0A7J8AUZ2_RHIFE|nr:hypothetical protein mRhiFer1_007828 [Rhinolophus ferrumequinum]